MNIAETAGLTTENVKQLRRMIASSTNVEFNEIFMNKEDNNDTPEQAFIKKEQEETIYNAITKNLTEIEQQIITMHYGLAGAGAVMDNISTYPTKKAFRDISQTLGLPYDKVRKNHASALRKLHATLNKNNVISELSQAEKILNKESIPIIPAEQGNIIMQALDETDIILDF
jgi:DNA-directed RNA polymerase specialized sigma subunit